MAAEIRTSTADAHRHTRRHTNEGQIVRAPDKAVSTHGKSRQQALVSTKEAVVLAASISAAATKVVDIIVGEPAHTQHAVTTLAAARGALAKRT